VKLVSGTLAPASALYATQTPTTISNGTMLTCEYQAIQLLENLSFYIILDSIDPSDMGKAFSFAVKIEAV
jgi:hypothetical protein